MSDVKDLWVRTSDDGVHVHADGEDCDVRHVVAYWIAPRGDAAVVFELPPDWDDGVAMNAVLMQVEASMSNEFHSS